MIDPLEAVLWYLLERRTSVATTDLCSWDEQRAERVMATARMHQEVPGQWAPTAATRWWSQRVWSQLRVDPRYQQEVDRKRKEHNAMRRKQRRAAAHRTGAA